jgi:hypothetical protein
MHGGKVEFPLAICGVAWRIGLGKAFPDRKGDPDVPTDGSGQAGPSDGKKSAGPAAKRRRTSSKVSAGRNQ